MIISAIIPCYQEIGTIETVLSQMSQQHSHDFDLEFLVVDGGSNDGTLEIIQEWVKKDVRFVLINNPQKTANHAFNLGINHSKGSHFALINAHTYYPSNYLQVLWETMKKTNCAGVSGRVIPIQTIDTLEHRLIYCLSTSAFGVSPNSYRMGKSGYTNSVSLPLFEKKAVQAVGLYHPELARNQDNDMNDRLIKAGYQLYVTSETTASYHPPKSFKKLLKYAFKSGVWNTKTWLMNIPCMKWYHFLPSFFTAGHLLGCICFIFSFHDSFWEVPTQIWIGTTLVYFILALIFSIIHPKSNTLVFIFLPIYFFCFHFTYGLGNLWGLGFRSKIPKF